MTQPMLLIIDDERGRFGPLTDLRAVFELRTGACTTQERIERVLACAAAAVRVPARLSALAEERLDTPVNRMPPTHGSALLVSGRWLGIQGTEQIRSLPLGQALIDSTGSIVAAHMLPEEAAIVLAHKGAPVLPPSTRPIPVEGRWLIDRPWHILDHLDACLRSDLSSTELSDLEPGQGKPVIVGAQAVFIDRSAKIASPLHTCIIAEAGPVVIEEYASIGPMTVIEGPCHIGAHSVISPHTSLRANTVIGPHCKVGGEVSHSIFQGYSNKAHAGFLGHSLVGQWVNLGADTTTSNLKNTYGSVRVELEPGSEPEDSRRTFQGAILGDYVRTAIGTKLTTGATVGTGAMVAVSGFASRCTKRFAHLTDAGEEPAMMDKLLQTLSTMMGRRQQRMTPALEQVLRELAKRK